MFIEERHREILKRLNASGTITTAEIQRLFGIGYDSAKRDLRILGKGTAETHARRRDLALGAGEKRDAEDCEGRAPGYRLNREVRGFAYKAG